jgi:hypothetical protein
MADQDHQDREMKDRGDEKTLALLEPLHTTPRVTPAPMSGQGYHARKRSIN